MTARKYTARSGQFLTLLVLFFLSLPHSESVGGFDLIRQTNPLFLFKCIYFSDVSTSVTLNRQSATKKIVRTWTQYADTFPF